MTYNRLLKIEVKEKVVARGIQNLDISNYHGIAVKYYSKKAYIDSIILKLTSMDKKPKISIPKYDIVVFDEVQDMTDTYMRFMRKFVMDIGTNPILVFLGDVRQSIYGFKGSDSRFLSCASEIWNEGRKFTNTLLSTTYRCTKQIASFVNEVMLGSHVMVSNKDGPPVSYWRCSIWNVASSIHSLIVKYLQKGYKVDDFFILDYTVKSEKTPIKIVCNYLVNKGL